MKPNTSFAALTLGRICLSVALGSVTLGAVAQAAVATSQPQIVRIGHAAPMTGPIGHLGQDNERGARLAIEEINKKGLVIGGRPIELELVVEDDAADPERAIPVANRLFAAGVAAVVGHLNSGTTITAAAFYSKFGIPMITPSATNPRLTESGLIGVFRLIANDKAANHAFGQYAAKILARRTAFVLSDNTAYGWGVADAFAKGFAGAGGKVLKREVRPDSSNDYSNAIQSISKTKPDLVFWGGMDTNAGPLLRQMRERSLNIPLLGSDGICTGQLSDLAGGPIHFGEVLCTEPGGITGDRKATVAAFNQRFTERFGVAPHIYSLQTYDAVNIIVNAMVRANSVAPAIFLPLISTTDHNGVSGRIRFNRFGDLRAGPVALFTYSERQRVPSEVFLTSD
jgi:branched-chain amino acid transport system substrate-binding protein